VTAANAEAVKTEKQKIQEAVKQKEMNTVRNLLKLGVLRVGQIAQTVGVSEDFVCQLSDNR
jgi:hypothetical protein